jgi:dihydroorotase
MFELVIRGGRVLDPAAGIDAVTDVAITGRRIAAIGPNLSARGVRQRVIDASGLLVTPGWIDMHTHVYWGVAPLGVEADPNCLYRGVTTAVDAGSAGYSTYPGFQRYVIDVAATRIKAMMHISAIGMAQDNSAAPDDTGELCDIKWANVDRAIEVARAYADSIVGIKVRLSEKLTGPDPENCREALRRTRQVADAIGKPVMIHPGGTTIPVDEILAATVRGDVVTHTYHGRSEGLLDDSGRVRRSVRAAVDRGVNFDVGHGAGSFSFAVAHTGLDQGLLPGTISSDIHVWNIAGPVFDLATTASKFLHLGMSLPDVIRRVTSTPAACIGLEGEIGTLRPGALADVSLFRLSHGEFQFMDSEGATEIGGQRLEPVAVIRAGKRYDCMPMDS